MIDDLRRVVLPLLDGQPVNATAMEDAVAAIMDGRCEPAEIASLLTALRCRGESVPQLVGAARAMRARSHKIVTRRRGLLDTCGTGGDALHTFNISTATAFVAAAAGATVAKHGNRSASSNSGSADVLEALGVAITLSAEQTARCIDEIGIGFCFAPRLHAAMKSAAPVRQLLGFRTIFNLLGPLTNPANAEYQLIGSGRTRLAQMLAEALAELGTGRALIVCGNDELDEVSLWGETAVFVVESGKMQRETWTPRSLGLPECSVGDLRVSSPEESAAVIRQVLAGEQGPARDIVLANTAAALTAGELAGSPSDGVARARAAIDSGRAAELLRQFAHRTQELAEPSAG